MFFLVRSSYHSQSQNNKNGSLKDWLNQLSVAIGVTSVKIIIKFATSGINYAEYKFYNIGHWRSLNKIVL
jgi:hypothetical protein